MVFHGVQPLAPTRTVVIWDASEGLEVLRRFKAHENGILGLAYGFGRLITCSGDKTVKLWDLESGRLELEIATRGIACDACMIDAETLLIAGGDATIRVQNWKKERRFLGLN